MVADTQTRDFEGSSRRRVPRFSVQEPLDVTVLRSGIPDKLPGRSTNVCERGIGAMLAGEVVPGESVGVEVRVPVASEPLRARAMVRHHESLHCGMEFVGLTADQRAVIRDWAKESGIETEAAMSPVNKERKGAPAQKAIVPEKSSETPLPPRKKGRRAAWIVVLLLVVAIAGALFWWRWNKGWEELESGLKNSQAATGEKPQVQVPAEVMEKLLVHRVEPTYPAEARQSKLEGTIALDVVIGRDGSVTSMRPLNGPDVLARAAMDALRWWKFEPYRLNGEPAIVETRVAVEFKR